MPKHQHPTTGQAQARLKRMFDAAMASAQPARCMSPHLPEPQSLGTGRLIVIGATHLIRTATV